MEIIKQVRALRRIIEKKQIAGEKLAFIPTMGALHSGHLSLVEIGNQYADTSICSIFVNPSQFNNKNDLLKYPRSLPQDINLLKANHCDILFAPSEQEVYPPGLNTQINLDLAHLEDLMEGEFRPGHFRGMLEVVKRLLDIVSPDYLIMGQKDFQQFTLVNHMIRQLQLPVELIIAPTQREKDGLAMSSRNQRLSPEMRQKAALIYQNLLKIQDGIKQIPTQNLESLAAEKLSQAGLRVEYVQIVDGNSLQKVSEPENHEYIVVCLAVWAGEVRLIDNLILKGGWK